MEENRKIRVAITHGDTNGIGYELIFKTFAAPEMLELCTPIIYGSPKVAAYHRKALDIQANFSIINRAEDAKDGRVNLLATFDEEIKVELGQPSEEAGMAALKALDRAIVDYRDGQFDVLVTAPIHTANIKSEGITFTGQTSYIEECFAENREAMTILLNDTLRVGLVTDNVAVKDIVPKIPKERLADRISTFAQTLKRDFRISNPRIAVLSLNPTIGTEEKEIIIPTIEESIDKHINAFGPYTSDDFFARRLYGHFDGILAMYHDQGIAPFMAVTPTDGIEMVSGLPIVCTSPIQGASYDIVGKNMADENPLRQAIYLAMDVLRNRDTYDEPLANPLPKLYHEKKDESEKVRFSIPKKHENVNKEKKQ